MARKFGTGLVIGKFCPPHLGHVALFQFAAAQVTELHILICDSSRYAIPGERRAAWIRNLAPANAKVTLVDEKHADDDSAGWAERTLEVLGFAPEKVFTSETYGEPFARFMGSLHVPFDPPRVQVPISATRVRENPHAAWDFLPAVVRGHYACRIAIVGPESSGKTTLALALARHYQTFQVPEYGRYYWEAKQFDRAGAWTDTDFLHIASEQLRLEALYAERANHLLFCDTNALCTSAWRRRYLGSYSAALTSLHAPESYALTLFCEPDFAFVQDGTRESEEYRGRMAVWLKELLALEASTGLLVLLSGSHDARLQAAITAVDRVAKTMRMS